MRDITNSTIFAIIFTYFITIKLKKQQNFTPLLNLSINSHLDLPQFAI